MESIMWQGFQQFTKSQLSRMSADSVLGVIYIDLIGFSRLERNYGGEISHDLLNLTNLLLNSIIAEFNRTSSWQASSHYVWGDGFAILLVHPVALYTHPLTHVAASLIHELEQRITREKPVSIATQDIHFRFGTQAFQCLALDDPEETQTKLYNAFVSASRQAKQSGGSVPLEEITEFEQIVKHKLISTLLQPIIDLRDQNLFGCEALSRGPKESCFFLPDQLIRTAEKLGELLALERVFREAGIKKFGEELHRTFSPPLTEAAHLFLNVHPQTIHDPNFTNGETMKLVHRYGLRPEQIIIEITEHQAIQDYPTFLESINHYRRQGYRIAIDDTGAGYAGLQMIVELMPDFIKLDMSMIRDVDKNPKKQIMVETMAKLAHNLGAKTIAEGIETSEELEMVKKLGVPYGQGFLLGKPESSIPGMLSIVS